MQAKRDIAAVALKYNGSISACHGSCREGEVDLHSPGLGRGCDVMLDIKQVVDPNNIMPEPAWALDQAYEGRA